MTYEVVRIYKGRRSVIYQGADEDLARHAYQKRLYSGPHGSLRDGDLILYADGKQMEAFHGGYNRGHW